MTVDSSFAACDAFVLGFDGSRNDSAPGEDFATSYGITQMTWDYAVSMGIVPDKPLSEGTVAEFEGIRRSLYWNAVRCSALAPGANLMVYNDAVLSGTGHTTKLLQRIVGAVQDGVIGRDTLRRANSFGDQKLIDALTAADQQYLSSLANAPLYLKGWLRREGEAHALAYQMAGLSK